MSLPQNPGFSKDAKHPDGSGPGPVRIIDVQRAVCAYYGIAHANLISKARNTEYVFRRSTAMYLCRTLTACSYPDIARNFGNRHHTTVMTAVNRISHRMQIDPSLSANIATISRLIIDACKIEKQDLFSQLPDKINDFSDCLAEFQKAVINLKKGISAINDINEIISKTKVNYDA